MKISSRFYYRFEKNPFIPSILTVCLVPFFNALTDQPLSDWSLPVVYSILTSFRSICRVLETEKFRINLKNQTNPKENVLLLNNFMH